MSIPWFVIYWKQAIAAGARVKLLNEHAWSLAVSYYMLEKLSLG